MVLLYDGKKKKKKRSLCFKDWQSLEKILEEGQRAGAHV
jgi:hypothetical protein